MDPVHVFQKLSQKMPGRDMKTIGNPTDKARDSSDLLKQIEKLDGNKSGVFKNGAKLLKQMRDIINKASTGGGGGSGSGSGMGAGLGGGMSSGAGNDIAKKLQKLIDKAEDGEEYDAVAEALDAIEDIIIVEDVLEEVKASLNKMVNNTTEDVVGEEIVAIWDSVAKLPTIDETNLPWRVVGNVMRCFRDILLTITFVWSFVPEGFGITRISWPFVNLFDATDLQGASVLIPDSDELITVMKDFAYDESEILEDAATRLYEYVREPAEDPTEDGCTKRQMIEYIEEWLKERGRKAEDLTEAEMKELIKFLLDSCKAKKDESLFSSQPNSDNAGSHIPDIGPMVEKTMKEMVKRSHNDQQKVKGALDKFTYNQAVAEKLRGVVKQKLERNKIPRASGGESS